MIGHLSEKQAFAQLGIAVTDLEHHASLLLARLHPEVAAAAYATALVLQLRQRDGAIAIPWPAVSGLPSDGQSVVSVLDLLTENLPLVKSGIATQAVREGFVLLGEVPLHRVIDGHVVVLDNHRLYLRRFLRYEQDVAAMVLSRSVPVFAGADENVNSASGTGSTTGAEPNVGADANAVLRTSTDAPPSQGEEQQHRAIQVGLLYRFAVITGGPGTGKTTSVLRLLLAMLEREPALRIVLCAPTGKAAARMMESIQGNLMQLSPPEPIRAGIPAQASTIHRLIRWNPSLGRSVYHAGNPLPYDVVILDEASMVDVALMSRLARALRPETRLVLLGDKDQLSSVEAGSVFADIASREVPNVVRLTRSWRFSADSPIGQLARLINAGDALASWEMLQLGGNVGLLSAKRLEVERSSGPGMSTGVGSGSDTDSGSGSDSGSDTDSGSYSAPGSPRAQRDLFTLLARQTSEKHTAITSEDGAYQALRQLSRMQILTALRVGPFGADQINTELDKRIGGGAEWYAGRPVMATTNNYDLQIFNGDIGITRLVEGRLMVAFEGAEPESVRWISPAQLRSVSSAWALTVHKSQGSEYDDVIFVLPDRAAPVLTRELAYTALTRARHNFRVWGTQPVWKAMITVQVPRYSGLADRLRSNP